MTVALIIVDVQNDFADPLGSLYVSGGELVAARLARVLASADPRARADVIVATQDWHGEHPGTHFDEWPVHCVASTWGAQLHRELASVSSISEIFYKGGHAAAYSGFEGASRDHESLDEYLKSKGVTGVTVVGLATDYCVKATALDAVRLGYRTTLDGSYCASVAPETTATALQEMRAVGVNVTHLH